MPASADPQRTRAAMQATLAALRDWRTNNEAANAQHLQDLSNMGDPEARARAIEHVAGGAGPSAALGAIPRLAALAGEAQAAGLNTARASNTFTGQASGAGSRVGYTQPPGTPVEKLFSNFADSSKASPEMLDAFREAMLKRAMGNPPKYSGDTLNSTVQPFPGGLSAMTDASSRGGTRVRVLDNGNPIAAANIDKGMLDSIAVDKAAKGRGIGADLLRYLDEQRIANIREVPDRSPGFINIQKQVLGGLAGGN